MLLIPGRIPIRIHPFFWLVAFGLGWLWTGQMAGTILCALVVFVSVLIHEFGHALMARAFGQEADILLIPFGGLTSRRGPALSRVREFLVIAAGPATGLLACLAALLIGKWLPPSLGALAFMHLVFVQINLWWSLLNLLPVIPLDGGRLMQLGLEGLFGFQGHRLGLLASLALCLGASSYLFLQGGSFVGVLLILFAMENAREFWRLRKVTLADRDPATAQLYDSAHAVLQQGRVEDALRLLDQVREKSPVGLYHVRASVDIAALLSQAGQLEQAFKIIQALEKELEGEGLDLYFELAYRMGDWERASRSGQRAYQQRPSYAKAFTLALVHAAQEEGPQTMGWLWRAQQDGMPQLLASLDRGEFDFLREDAHFEKLKKVLGGDSTS